MGLAAGPDGVLLGPGEHGDGLDEVGVRRQWAVSSQVGSQDVCQGRGVDGVRLSGDHDSQQPSEAVDHQVTRASVDLLAAVEAA